MNIILFLDFDGVLHPYFKSEKDSLFMYLPNLEKVIREFNDIDIVISSNWRLNHSIEELKDFFSSDIREKIIGITPEIKPSLISNNDGIRQKEIELFINNNGLNDRVWIALDDDLYAFNNKELVYHCLDKFDENDIIQFTNKLSLINQKNNKKLKF